MNFIFLDLPFPCSILIWFEELWTDIEYQQKAYSKNGKLLYQQFFYLFILNILLVQVTRQHLSSLLLCSSHFHYTLWLWNVKIKPVITNGCINGKRFSLTIILSAIANSQCSSTDFRFFFHFSYTPFSSIIISIYITVWRHNINYQQQDSSKHDSLLYWY